MTFLGSFFTTKINPQWSSVAFKIPSPSQTFIHNKSAIRWKSFIIKCNHNQNKQNVTHSDKHPMQKCNCSLGCSNPISCLFLSQRSVNNLQQLNILGGGGGRRGRERGREKKKLWNLQAPQSKPSVWMLRTLFSISFMSVVSSHGLTSRMMLLLAIRAGSVLKKQLLINIDSSSSL